MNLKSISILILLVAFGLTNAYSSSEESDLTHSLKELIDNSKIVNQGLKVQDVGKIKRSRSKH